ncbi:hypothetical protein [Chromobacterium alticapitis]|uniref:hypothetical protein n=1 Tax=Chromobacterium alticapitis TaxID=2073169 RepID=UPI001304A38F|nr:hypothetical protein [Chromobacterium alticapitis]
MASIVFFVLKAGDDKAAGGGAPASRVPIKISHHPTQGKRQNKKSRRISGGPSIGETKT